MHAKETCIQKWGKKQKAHANIFFSFSFCLGKMTMFSSAKMWFTKPLKDLFLLEIKYKYIHFAQTSMSCGINEERKKTTHSLFIIHGFFFIVRIK